MKSVQYELIFYIVYAPPELLRDWGKILNFFSNIIFFKFNSKFGLLLVFLIC